MGTDTLDAPARLDIEVCREYTERVEVRSADGAMPVMRGHFSIFNTWYEIDSFFEGRFLERVAPGAFKKTFRESGDRIRVLLEHGFDPTVGDKPLGVPRALNEDSTGAYYEVPLFDTSYNRDLVPALEAGAYGASFRFKVVKDNWVKDPGRSADNPDGIPERTITEVRVMEFGPTVFPASPTATAGLRSSTDRYYEQLRRRAPELYDEALRSVKHLRTPAADSAAKDTPAAAGTGAADSTAPKVRDAASRKTDEPRKHSEAKNTTKTPRSTEMTAPMGVEERRDRQDEIRARLAEIDAEHDGGELSDEARGEFDTLTAEYDVHERAIKDIEARRRRIAERARNENATERSRPEWPTNVNVSRNSDIYDLGEIRKQARSMDDMVRLTRENARRAVERAKYPGAHERAAAQAQVERLLDTVDDEQGTLARRILVTGSPTYQRAFGKMCVAQSTHGLTADEQRALAVGAGATGGFAVPFELDPTVILTNSGSINPLRQISRVEQIVGKEWQGITSAGITVTRAAEATEASDNSPTLVQPTVKPERVQGFVPFSIEVDQDWGALQSEMTRLLADAKDQEEATSFVTGTGVSPQANGVIQTLNASSNVNAVTITAASIYALETALPPRFRARARWAANKAIFNAIRQLDTQGGAQMWERIGAGMPSELLGYPAHELSTMVANTTPALNDKWLLFGDFQQFLIVDRVGMTVDLVPHLFGAGRMPTGQRGIYAIWRNNSKILTDAAFRVNFRNV